MLTFGGPPPLAIDQSRATKAHAAVRTQITRALADRSVNGAGPAVVQGRAAVRTAERAAESADLKVKADQAASARVALTI